MPDDGAFEEDYVAYANRMFKDTLDAWREQLPKCVHCGNLVQPAIYGWKQGTGTPPEPGTWVHGVARLSGFWQGLRCAGGMTGATPPEDRATR